MANKIFLYSGTFFILKLGLPRTCACTRNFMCTCVCFRAHVRARRCKLRRETLHYWQAGAPQCIVQSLYETPLTKLRKSRQRTHPLSSNCGEQSGTTGPAGTLKNDGRPAGALECIVQPVPNVPDKITEVPSTHTSRSSSCGEQPCTIGWPALLNSSCGAQPCSTGPPARPNA